MNTLMQLKNYTRDNSAAELAGQLGYKSSETIRAWIKRKSIPHWAIESVEEFLKKKGYYGKTTKRRIRKIK